MSSTLTARLPDDLAGPLEAYCADSGTTKTEVVVEAVRAYLRTHKRRPTAYELAMQLMAARPDIGKGLPQVQAADAKRILREKFRAKARGH